MGSQEVAAATARAAPVVGADRRRKRQGTAVEWSHPEGSAATLGTQPWQGSAESLAHERRPVFTGVAPDSP